MAKETVATGNQTARCFKASPDVKINGILFLVFQMLVAKGIATSNKGITTSNKKLLVAKLRNILIVCSCSDYHSSHRLRVELSSS